ncbi:hypothetical protein [Streptomyces naganishii]|uniref:Secreted protein n=1 Tax=Streptomyces naganishii JCM 4654 TaxID=1306179 RepID=A0A919CUI1_9ACTN|nr:hypothetical protein [Streptomyces naganishii]GHD86982.1 hypothetical protein GCM10010508_16970 [Streptomyces naganishii JCM 4654]
MISPTLRTRPLARLAAAPLLAAVVALTLPTARASAADATPAGGTPAAVAAAFRQGPVYVDPRVGGELPKTEADRLAEKIKKADKPVFVAVLPDAAEYPRATLLRDLRSLTGVAGVYAVRLGTAFNAGADHQVMSNSAVDNLKGAVRRSYAADATAEVNAFVDQALQQAKGHAPASWEASSGGGSTAGLLVAGLVVAGVAGGGLLLYRRVRKQREARERAELRALRLVVDEDITAFGEELDRLDFSPTEPGATDEMREDYTRALDAYDRAKRQMDAATHPQDVRPVTETLADGRFALAVLAARRTGAPLPQRRVPCFFDPRHGPSVSDVNWSPPGGAPRMVPACADDAAIMSHGGQPMTRMVHTDQGAQPYWSAGPAYAPWAGGYFGVSAGVVGGLLAGTLLGGLLSGPAFADAGDVVPDAGGRPEGGEFSGADFSPSDFEGGFGDVGADGGGGFGGDW